MTRADAERIAAETVPCNCGAAFDGYGNHSRVCQSNLRPAIAAALMRAWEAGKASEVALCRDQTCVKRAYERGFEAGAQAQRVDDIRLVDLADLDPIAMLRTAPLVQPPTETEEK